MDSLSNRPEGVIVEGDYELRFAATQDEIDALLKLRYDVFNVELGVGVASDAAKDEDDFDAVCHHLIVKHIPSGELVGTYRMQHYGIAQANLGLYTAQEFDVSSIPQDVLDGSVEIGRLCVHQEHRGRRVLMLLWKGLAMYLAWSKMRYLLGCCSFMSVDPKLAQDAWNYFMDSPFKHPSIYVEATEKYAVRDLVRQPAPEDFVMPSLMKVYFMYGSRICSGPALDLAFHSIDFMILFDLEDLDPRHLKTFFGKKAS